MIITRLSSGVVERDLFGVGLWTSGRIDSTGIGAQYAGLVGDAVTKIVGNNGGSNERYLERLFCLANIKATKMTILAVTKATAILELINRREDISFPSHKNSTRVHLILFHLPETIVLQIVQTICDKEFGVTMALKSRFWMGQNAGFRCFCRFGCAPEPIFVGFSAKSVLFQHQLSYLNLSANCEK